jgi:hypothetical protein
MLFYTVRLSFWAEIRVDEAIILDETGLKFKEYTMKKISIAIMNATESERSLR